MLSIFLVTFNCARTLVDVEAFSQTLLHALTQRDGAPPPDLVVLALQEIAPVAQSFLGGGYLEPFFASIVQAVQTTGESLQQQYDRLIALNVGMIGLVILAKAEIVGDIPKITTAGVGVGDYDLGNKGSAAVRLFYAPTGTEPAAILTFAAAHLAPFENAWERRNQDWESIVRGLCFKSNVLASASKPRSNHELTPEHERLLSSGADVDAKDGTGLFIGDSPVFFAGDLNYRTSDVSPMPQDSPRFPQPQSREDVGDNRKVWSVSDLKANDQLSREKGSGKTLHNLDEMPLDFPPTYKYAPIASQQWPKDGSEPASWIWSTHRYPSFCDRVLFSSSLTKYNTLMKTHSYQALALQPTSDHRPVALDFELDIPSVSWNKFTSESEQVSPFPLDPKWRERRAAARWKETCLGTVAYLAMTWNGNGVVFASLLGGVAGWLVMRSLLSS
ncbi:MAG: hypothetical protein M1828_000292 [Chrysothrix sp. TS-e1954]|nr:MAG: hypothetical protein M1828_000292 [Chrysothrix sp. TS-e1954]